MIGSLHSNSMLAPGASWTRVGFDLRSLWIPVVVFVNLMLFLPYTTGAMQWAYAQGYVPFQPMVFMLSFGVLAIVLSLINRPEFTTVALLVLGVAAARAIDASFLKRFLYPEPHKTQVFFLISVVFMIVVSAFTVGLMRRGTKAPVVAVSVGTVLVCSFVNLYEFLGFAVYSAVEGRAAGFLEDANNSAIAITLMLGVFLSVNRGFWVNALMVGISAMGVFVTLSRSGILVYMAMLAVWGIINLRSNFRRMALIAAVGIPLASMGAGAMVAFSAKSAGVRGDANVEGRLAALFGGDLEKMASSERTQDLVDGLAGIAKAPVAGLGTGAGTALYMPHNQLLSVWIDIGLVGVLFYGGLLVVLAWKCLASGFRGVFCLIPIIGFVPFSQTLIETAAYWFAALVLISMTSQHAWSFSIFGRRSERVPRGAELGYGELAPVRLEVRR